MNNKVSSNIRIDESIWEDLRYYANKNKRSINKEIEYALENYVKKEKRDKRLSVKEGVLSFDEKESKEIY